MKLLCSLFVLVSLGIFVPNSYADPVLSINAGAAGGILLETPILGGETWTYTDTSITVDSLLPPVAQVSNGDFVATFTDIAGVALLSVTDVCANVNVNVAGDACSALAFTFTDAGLGTPVLDSNVAALGALGLDLNADAVGIGVGASIGGGSAQIGFSNPAPTPEPGTLTLMGTGLLGVAGFMRRRLAGA